MKIRPSPAVQGTASASAVPSSGPTAPPTTRARGRELQQPPNIELQDQTGPHCPPSKHANLPARPQGGSRPRLRPPSACFRTRCSYRNSRDRLADRHLVAADAALTVGRWVVEGVRERGVPPELPGQAGQRGNNGAIGDGGPDGVVLRYAETQYRTPGALVVGQPPAATKLAALETSEVAWLLAMNPETTKRPPTIMMKKTTERRGLRRSRGVAPGRVTKGWRQIPGVNEQRA